MEIAVIITFVLGYLFIVFEEPLKLDKSIPALLLAVISWAIISFAHLLTDYDSVILHFLGTTSEILMFLIGAMTIVEIVSLHKGFHVIKEWITTRNKTKLLWITSVLCFFLSAVIDNLTTTIVLISILRTLIKDRNERIWYVSLMVVAANAGGAFSPIGDVTTTMLWIGDKVTTLHLIDNILLPSIVSIVIPLIIVSFYPVFQGDLKEVEDDEDDEGLLSTSKFMFFLGIIAILCVPVFKTVLHIPPYLGMMGSLAVVWLASEYIHPSEKFEEGSVVYSGRRALSRIEMSSIIFFFGILMGVGALESLGILQDFANYLESIVPTEQIVVLFLGILSAIVDNVPLVAATMGMYTAPTDSMIWHLIAYACGTGGSILIIGSAAGVAAMGIERIDFLWYMKRISIPTLIGFLAGFALLWALEYGFNF